VKNRIRNGGSRADDAYLAQTLDAERAHLIVVLVDEDDRYLILGLIWLFFSYLNNLSRLREHTPVDATKRAVGFLCRIACGFTHWAVAALINVLRPSRSASCRSPFSRKTSSCARPRSPSASFAAVFCFLVWMSAGALEELPGIASPVLVERLKSAVSNGLPIPKQALPASELMCPARVALGQLRDRTRATEQNPRARDMKNTLTITAAAFLISTSAFAQSVGEKTGVNSTLGISPTTADFVKEAATSDMAEIAASKLGQERGNAKEKSFASQMITDHTKTSEELKSIAPADAKAAIPTALDSSSQSKIDKLKDAKPDSFSSDFDSIQVSAHKDAVSLFERYAKSGEDPKLKDWAGKTLPTLQHHLEMAQDLGKTK
jgi:putative membrane protein